MRSQLVRRTQDLKKNIAGAGRFLEILREMSSVVSEMKMFNVNESLDQNTKKMCILQVQSHTRTWIVVVFRHAFCGGAQSVASTTASAHSPTWSLTAPPA